MGYPMLFFRKLFKLPSPKELGRSDYNALPSRDFSPDCEGYTWEDWNEEVKAKYPIRYFFAETLSDFIKFNVWFPIYHPIHNFCYFIKSHTINRYHILDLRQPDNEFSIDIYRYGYRDVPERMLYALFNLLDQFVNNELPHYYCPPEEDIDNKIQRDVYFEILAIHTWWVHDRKVELHAINKLRDEYHDLRKINKNNSEEMWKNLRKRQNDLDNKTDDMVDRLIKIRHHLWT